MEKPRIIYSEFAALKQRELTLSFLIRRYVRDIDASDRPLGDSHRWTLLRISNEPFAQKLAEEYTDQDFIEYAKERRKKVCAATVGQDIGYIMGVLKYAKPAWKDCAKVSAKPLEDAKPFLQKRQIIGKSQKRSRRPTPDEITKLLAYFAKQNEDAATKIDMVKVLRWQQASARRISETCRVTWLDWDWSKRTMLVRKMKDPKNRNKQKRCTMTPDAQAMLEELAWEMNERPELRTDEPRIFPYKSSCCSQRYVDAKKELGIEDLHLHDSRRDRCSRLIEEDGLTPAQATAVSGHDTDQIFQGTYMRVDPELIAEQLQSTR